MMCALVASAFACATACGMWQLLLSHIYGKQIFKSTGEAQPDGHRGHVAGTNEKAVQISEATGQERERYKSRERERGEDRASRVARVASLMST